jgi:hypothetical protein
MSKADQELRAPDIVNLPMRRNDKEIINRRITNEILDDCTIGYLGTVGPDGFPVVKPVNFVQIDNSIYFHTAKEGEKIEHVKYDNRVCFTVAQPLAYVKAGRKACKAAYLYRSVIIKGRAYLIDNADEKLAALDALMAKHQPGGTFDPIDAEHLNKTGIVRIDIESITGKEDLGKGAIREKILKALEDDATFPIILDDAK